MNLKSLEGETIIFRAKVESLYLNKSTSSKNYPNRWIATLTNLRCKGKLVKFNCRKMELDVTKHYHNLLEGDIIKFKSRVSLNVDNRFKNVKKIEIVKSPLENKAGEDYFETLSKVCDNMSTRKNRDKVNTKINKEDVFPLIVKSNRENGTVFTFTYLLENIKTVGWGYKTLYKELLFKSNPEMYFVYQLKRGEDVVYVGSSKGLGSRLTSHKKDKDFDKVLICL